MAHIELHDINLTFTLRLNKGMALKEFLLRHLFRTPLAETIKQVDALKNINLVIGEGERLGIIGRNGAGKSTFLKMLSGIYPPTSGRKIVRGKISSLFDIALGFETHSNGWDNIRYRGYLQGETPATLKDKIQPIAQFSELGKFMDMPMRYYSAGMSIRLAFSIATAIDPEILLVDEVLSVGDLGFQEKARIRMKEMMSKAKIMVMVSHDLNSVKKMCNRVIWLNKGSIHMDGSAEEVVDAYKRETHHPQNIVSAAA